MDPSETRRLYHEIRSVIDSLPDLREDKVAFLRQQIRNRRYRPDAEEIARRMVAEEIQTVIVDAIIGDALQ